jgi:hypothetical protein
MANRYWVGGTGTWDATTTTNWSTSSGGSGGASVPSTADVAIFDSLSNATSYTVTRTATTNVLGMTMAGSLTGTLTFAGSSVIGITTSGLTVTATGVSWTNTGIMSFTGTCSVTTNGVSIASPITINGSGITVTLGSALTTTSAFTLTLGTLLTSSFSVTVNTLTWGTGVIGVNVSGGGQFYITGSNATICTIPVATNTTITGTATINSTYSGAVGTRTFTISNGSVNYNITAGTDITTHTSGGTANNFNFTGFTGTYNPVSFTYTGTLTLNSGMTVGATGNITFNGASASLTDNGVSFPNTLTIAGGSFIFNDNVTGQITNLRLNGGTLNFNNKNVQVGTFATGGTVAKSLILGTGTLLCTNLFSTLFSANTTTGGLTIDSTGSTIQLNNNSSGNTFAGNGYTYNNILFSGNSSANYTFTGANTFTGTISSTKTAALNITLPASATTTVNSWTASGGSGRLLTLVSSTAGTQATLNLTGGGIVSVDYLSIQDISATPSSLTWYAGTHSTNVSNNTGWIFSSPSTPANFNFFAFFNGS